jgi:hypothetical protein
VGAPVCTEMADAASPLPPMVAPTSSNRAGWFSAVAAGPVSSTVRSCARAWAACQRRRSRDTVERLTRLRRRWRRVASVAFRPSSNSACSSRSFTGLSPSRSAQPRARVSTPRYPSVFAACRSRLRCSALIPNAVANRPR